ncbi:MAG: PAS domain S-box protein [Clostridiales bacterium]|nr:PAS domain S-box protein [Clostridiales bacterium]
MNTMSLFYMIFSGMTLGISVFYFYIFARSREVFVQYWGLSWVLYSCGLLFLSFGNNSGIELFFCFKSVLDLFNVLFLLCSAYAFVGRKTPGVWTRFSFYICIWVATSQIYSFDPMSSSLPLSMYQAIVTLVLIYVVYNYWNVLFFEKIITIITFFIWGIGKAAIPIIEALDPAINIDTFYVGEIIIYNVVTIITFLLFFQRSQKKLDTTQHMFQIIAENASDVLFLYGNTNGSKFEYITPSIEKMIGIGPSRFYSNGRCYMDFIHPDDCPVFQRLLDTDDPETDRKATLRLYHKNGNMLWCEVATTKVTENGITVATEGIIRDITLTKEAEEQLISSKEARNVLLSYVSHELKTPITSILGYVTALTDGSVSEDNQKNEMLHVIYDKTRTLDRLIFDLTQLSKLETKQFSFDFSIVNCIELSSSLILSHIHDGDSRGIKLYFNINKRRMGDKSIIADPDRLDQVFTNILSNSLRFSQAGQDITIKFDVDKSMKFYTFSLTNRGPVISREDIPDIFDRFYRIKRGQQSANENNSGLGLTISKEMIAAHKGNIGVTSSNERGTTFTVSVPLFDESEY